MSSKKATVSAVVPLKNVPGVDPAPAAKLRVLPAVASSFPVSNLPEEILTGEQVAERLKLEPSTVYELTRRRNKRPMPSYRAGKYLRFYWSEVEAWLKQSRTP